MRSDPFFHLGVEKFFFFFLSLYPLCCCSKVMVEKHVKDFTVSYRRWGPRKGIIWYVTSNSTNPLFLDILKRKKSGTFVSAKDHKSIDLVSRSLRTLMRPRYSLPRYQTWPTVLFGSERLDRRVRHNKKEVRDSFWIENDNVWISTTFVIVAERGAETRYNE